MTSRANRRLIWLAAVVLLWAIAIVGNLVYLQVIRHDSYLRMARRQQERVVELKAPRGSIFDRNGQPLAMSVPMDSVSVNPQHLPDIGVASDLLSRILEIDRLTLHGRLRVAQDAGRGFVWVKRKITPEQAQSLRSLRLGWIHFHQESQRHYPNGALGAHLLGSVDHEEHGNAGLEAALEDELAGHAGALHMLTDVKRRGIDARLAAEPQPGAAFTLSIDARIQYVAERELARAVQDQNARAGSLAVMNPHTGDILAMASYPSYDPNKPPSRGEPAHARLNNPVSVPFEPGSVFKVFTLAAALETTSLRPDTLINCGNGSITLFGRTIREATRGYGIIPMSTVLAKSSNVGSIQIGLRVGEERLYEYVRRFGFGRRTGIAMPAESPGIVRKLSVWGKTSLGSVAMGHEIGTTTLQLARACSAIANGGLLVKPRILLRKDEAPLPSPAPERVLRPETSITMRQMMEGAVVGQGATGHRARLNGYSSGGKTGSAQIYDFAARRYTSTYNGSFMGFAPVVNPAIVVVVTLNGTRTTRGFGGVSAAPVFKVVAEEALRVLDIPKDLPELPEDQPNLAETEDAGDLAIADLAQPPVLEEGPAEEQQVAGPGELKVPDFQGLTMRAVLAQASELGLPVLVDGSGVARLQQPPPGTVLPAGERVRVRFAR
jgi:cell division protein FtsI (penicillin-binding protein 3)